MSVSQQPLNIRNNNPGNLRFVGQPGATQGEGGFARFETPDAGMAAMRAQIELDTQKRGLNLTDFLNKYAPPTENDTNRYIGFVTKKTGLDPKAKITPEAIPLLQNAMIEMEGGPRSLSYFQSVSQPTQVAQATPKPTTTVPAKEQEPRTTVPKTAAPKEKQAGVQVAAATAPSDLPSSYTAALALNYLADTDPEGKTMAKVNEMLAEMMEDQGGAKRPSGGQVLQQYAKSKSVDPFQFVMQQEEEAKPQRRAVPRMPKPQMFAQGGAVSNEVPQVDAQGRVIREAPVPERSFSVGERIVGAGEAGLAALSGLTAPASIMYDVARGVPRNEISPGNFMYQPRTEAGQATAEDLGRFMQDYKLDAAIPQVQLQRPYPAMAAARQGIAAVENAVTAPIDRAKVRAAASRAPEDVAYDPLRERLESQGILSLATRPGGSLMIGDEATQRLTKMMQESEVKPPQEAFDNFMPKFTAYMQKQYSTPSDPLFQATLEGRFKPRPFYSPNRVFDDYAKPIEKVTGIELEDGKKLNITHIDKLLELSKAGNEEAREIVAWGADRSLQTKGVFTQDQTANALKDTARFNGIAESLQKTFEMGFSPYFGSAENVVPTMRAYVRQNGLALDKDQQNLFRDIEYKYAQQLQMDEAAKRAAQTTDPLQTRYPISLSPLYEHERQGFETSLTAPMREELARGKPVYKSTETYGKAFDEGDVFDYMAENDPAKWSKMSVPELIIAASSKNPASITNPTRIARMADDGLPLTPAQRFVGTKKFLPIESESLGKGAEWREITSRDGLRIEGGIMQHCLKRDASGYCTKLMDKEAKYFTLRDADGQPYVSIEMAKPIGKEKEDVPYSVIRQVKGPGNSNPLPLYGEEIADFLTDWQNKMGVRLSGAEKAENLPKEFRSPSFGMEAPPENFRRGGMVDKPLYDRAA
jgi:hypothetical protein